ncbi:uncharacterized protein LOC118513618 isoform X1 [Anopheles stephensi]|uniref:uncharacterized protein LOC118513618 isoform X1 n=1 Tax=Anopheles stephensi TaxID=30069 RepID=UPI0016587345|nr:uncharacterized protein LOC118513618 isoform X1 [Anopheles stephensi]
MESFCLKKPALNFLRNAGKKVIVECDGHVYAIPQQDFLHVSRTTKQSKLEHQLNGGRPASDTLSEVSDSNLSHDHGTPVATSLTNPEVSSSSAARVLSELKEEVTRLIDESIQKIELEWMQSTKCGKDAVPEEEVVAPPEATPEPPVRCSEETSKTLHPDGDRGLLGHREQNLQVLHTELFVTCKRQTRMKLLNEIRDLVERLKDLETLGE